VPPTPRKPTTKLPFAAVEMNRPVTDPVCGRTVTQATAKAFVDRAEGSVSFCSAACRELYLAAPCRP